MEDEIAAEVDITTRPRRYSADLKPRLIAGVGLAVAAGLVAWSGVVMFGLFILVIALLMSWEWSRVVRSGEFDATLLVHAASTTIAAVLAAYGLAALGLAAVVAGAIIVVALELGARSMLSAAGVLYTGVPVVAMLWFRGDEPWGFMAVLFLFTVVAMTDTLAYFIGRAIGGPKLIPAISPNKTWAGFIGGISAAALTGASFHYLTGASPVTLGFIGLALGLVSQGGDLAESALKRAFGVKDASSLIPGHGGFMDRADGLVAASAAAGLLALFVDPASPASALLALVR